MIPVAAAVIYKDKKILIARRAPGKHMAGYWEFPGGKIEPGETPEQCLLREIHEELGISISVGHFLGEHLHDYGESKYYSKPTNVLTPAASSYLWITMIYNGSYQRIFPNIDSLQLIFH